MRAWHLFACGILAGGTVLTGFWLPSAQAQQHSSSTVTYQSGTMRMSQQGQVSVVTLQGHVVIRSSDGSPVSLTAGSDGFTWHGDTDKVTARIPMDMTTLRVTVTPSGTTFQDQKGNSLTIPLSNTSSHQDRF